MPSPLPTSRTLAAVFLCAAAITAPQLAHAAPPAATQPLSSDDVHKLVDAGQYKDGLRALLRILQLSGVAAAPYDRHDMLMLKAECLIQIHDNNTALTALAQDQKETLAAGKVNESLLAAAFAELIQKSPGSLYTPHVPPGQTPIKLLDRTLRDKAYDALFNDDFDVFRRKSTAAVEGKSLPGYIDAAKAAAAMRAAEYASTKSTKQSEDAIKDTSDKSLKLINGVLDGLANQNKIISDAATRMVSVPYNTPRGMGQYIHERGLLPADITALKNIIDICTKVPAAATQLGQQFGIQIEDFKAAALRADDIKDSAKSTLTADYTTTNAPPTK